MVKSVAIRTQNNNIIFFIFSTIFSMNNSVNITRPKPSTYKTFLVLTVNSSL